MTNVYLSDHAGNPKLNFRLPVWFHTSSHWSHFFYFAHGVFQSVSSNFQIVKTKSHWSHFFTFPPSVSSNCKIVKTKSHWLHFVYFSPLCVFKCLLKLQNCKHKVTLVAFSFLFSTVLFQMGLQMVCVTGFKVTLITVVWLFSTVQFQMFPRITCLRGGIITIVAFIWLLSSVCFQMCS